MSTLALAPTAVPAQQTSVSLDRWSRAALEWVELLRTGDFARAAFQVDAAVPAGALGAEQLSTIWSQVSGQLGALVRVGPGRVSESGAFHLVDLEAGFERQAVTLRVVLTDALLVSGLFVRPPDPPAYQPPAYVKDGSFREVEVTVGSPPWTLPGVLTLPVGEGPFAGVVLVHGSGPNDGDETVGGNRPFRDLAWGLASGGVAVLRYDKRTRVYGTTLPADLGPEEEVVVDAVAALGLMRSRTEVDPVRVFVLGHSLGGMLAPDIGLRDGKVAGVVVLAAPVRPFMEVLRDQLEYVGGLQRAANPVGAPQVDSLLATLDRIAREGMAPGESFLGAPGAYWRKLGEVDPLGSARRLDCRILVLQGGRDYQSTPTDLELWRAGLEGRAGASTRLYPGLNHLFAAGEGRATPEEYATTVKHVDPAVIEELLNWIRGEGDPGPAAVTFSLGSAGGGRSKR